MALSPRILDVSIKRLFLLACLAIPFGANAQTPQKYFGYFGGDYTSTAGANPGGPSLDEMKDHINLYNIQAWSGDVLTPEGIAASENYVMGELARAKAAHVHATVQGMPFIVPMKDENSIYDCPDHADPEPWNHLAQRMVDEGYLIPGDSTNSTVVAVYIMDEPDSQNCFMDKEDRASPTFTTMVNVVRQNPNTANLAIAAIFVGNGHWLNMYAGMQLIDWVGFDYYPGSPQDWKNEFDSMKLSTPGKKYIIVPGAMQNCPGVQVQDSAIFKATMSSDPDVVWFAPFAWFSGAGNNPACRGVRDIPSLRSDYTAVGAQIKSAQCNASSADHAFCGL